MEIMVPRYFVYFSIYRYDQKAVAEFEFLDEVITFLTENARNEDFEFDVVCGERVEFEPAEVVKTYRPKKR